MTHITRPSPRFGLLGADDAATADQAREAEDLGYDLFALSDHLHGTRPTLEPWTALAWAAAVTERITLLTDVLGLPYREPAVLAKMAETFDRLSGGRLILGLGNGGYDPEFSAFGLAQRTPGEKVNALGEAIQIIRALWTAPAASFSGRHYRVSDAQVRPRPEHAIPIWLGAYGARALAQTGALANGWLPSMQRLDLAQAVTMRAAVRSAAAAAGRDPQSVVAACNVAVSFDAGASPTPQRLTGSAAAISAQLRRLVDVGFDTFIVAGLSDPHARRRFAQEVIPRVRYAGATGGPIPAGANAGESL